MSILDAAVAVIFKLESTAACLLFPTFCPPPLDWTPALSGTREWYGLQPPRPELVYACDRRGCQLEGPPRNADNHSDAVTYVASTPGSLAGYGDSAVSSWTCWASGGVSVQVPAR